ncbi:hypothetical protein, partial [Oceanospirillum sediminis]
HQSSFSFVTATVLSLGMILMPLLKLDGVRFSINDLLLDAFQIFLAVSVLVYSVVILKSKYDVRSSNINACGDKIKFLARELEYELGQWLADQVFGGGDNLTVINMTEFK